MAGSRIPHLAGDGAFGASAVLEYMPTGWPAGSITTVMAPVPCIPYLKDGLSVLSHQHRAVKLALAAIDLLTGVRYPCEPVESALSVVYSETQQMDHG